jgi:hypothetical protein
MTVLDAAQRAILKSVLNCLVPARANLPGAGDLDVGASIESSNSRRSSPHWSSTRTVATTRFPRSTRQLASTADRHSRGAINSRHSTPLS